MFNDDSDALWAVHVISSSVWVFGLSTFSSPVDVVASGKCRSSLSGLSAEIFMVAVVLVETEAVASGTTFRGVMDVGFTVLDDFDSAVTVGRRSVRVQSPHSLNQ